MVLTTEEKRVKAYSGNGSPTNPNDVSSSTELGTLNLNWTERQLPERDRTKHVHRLHPYLGKFIPQLVEIFLRRYFVPGKTVLDPFCGSGTTLVQANELGIHAVGYDVSAFNVLLCEAKTDTYLVKRMRDELLDILEKVRTATNRNGQQSNLWDTKSKISNATVSDKEYLDTWFAPSALSELTTYLSLIESTGYKYRKLMKVVLSRAARSSRLTTHFDLDFPRQPQTGAYWCYKHSRECSPTTDAFKFLERYTIDTIRRVEEFAGLRTDATVVVRHSDSRRAKFPSHDGVLTSPPYVGLIDYHQQHAYAYALLGLHDKREEEIGPAVNGSGQKAREKYKEDIASVFRRAAESMRPGGRIIVVANDKSDLYDEIAKGAGLEVEDVIQRHVNRRTGRRSTDFFESVFIWRNGKE